MGSSHSKPSRQYQQNHFPKSRPTRPQRLQASELNCWVGADNRGGGSCIQMDPIGLGHIGLQYCAMRGCPKQPQGKGKYWRPLLSDPDDKIVWHNTKLADGSACSGVFHASCFSTYLQRRYVPHKGRVPRPMCPCCDGSMNVAFTGCSRDNPMGFERFTGYARL